MRVSIVTETFPPEINGVAMTVHRLSEGLAAQGHELTLIRPRQGQEETNAEAWGTQWVRGVPMPGYPGLQMGVPAGRLLRRIWRKQRPDAVYVATAGPLGWSAVRAASALGLTVVTGFHTNFHHYSRYYGLSLLEKAIYRYLCRFHNRSAVTLVPDEDLLKQLVGDIPNVAMLERGVDCALFSPEKRSDTLRRSWGVKPDDKVILYVGRLAREKNIPLAIRAFREMRRFNPGVRLVVVGEGPAYTDIYNPYDRMVFAGTLRGEALARYYASADIFLFPSETETFGNVTLEAMASGLALVAFDYAAAKRHVSHGVNGLLARPGDHDAFCRLATSMIADPSLPGQLGKAARRTVKGLDWVKISRDFESLLLGPAAAPAPMVLMRNAG